MPVPLHEAKAALFRNIGHPIRIRVGERVRLYFVNVLEHDPINSLHLHATFFHSYRTDAADEVGETRVVEFPPNPLDVGYTLDF